MSDLLHFQAGIEIRAAEGKQPTFSGVVYSGGPMRVAGFGQVVVDIAGADLSGAVPVLVDHGETIDGLVGQGTATAHNGTILAHGTLTTATEAGAKVVALARSGVSLQASIGFAPDRREFIHAGATIMVNNQTITAGAGGLTIVRSGRLREISLVPIGADPDTNISIAASRGGKATSMPNETTITTPDQPGMSAPQRVLARWTAATFHNAHIRQQLEPCLTAALSGDITFDDFDREVLRAQLRDAQLTAARSERPQGPAIHSSSRDLSGDAAEAALLCHLGHEGAAVKTLGEQATQAGRSLGLHSLHDILRAKMQHEGIDVPAARNDMIRAAFSTASIAGILGNAANKISVEAYRAVPSVARMVAKKLTANDFKDHTGYRLTGDSTFDELGPGGEIKHGSLTESSFSYRVATHARMFGLTRQDVINDDLGKFEEVPRLLGRGSATRLESLFWTLVLANTGSFFGAGNNNYIDGADTALSITGLAAAVTALRQLVDSNGDPISILPKYLVVPPELEAVADQLFASTNVVVSEASTASTVTVPDSNPFKGKYQPQVSPYLSNANYSGYSATGWYLFGDPGDVAAFGIAYLDGVENPIVEQADADFNTLGIQFRGYHDFGVCQVDSNGAVMSKGTT